MIIGGTNTPPELEKAPDYLLSDNLQKILEENGYKVFIFSASIPKPSLLKKKGIINYSEIIEASNNIAKIVSEQRKKGRFILSFWGDHLIDVGVVKGILESSKRKFGVIMGDGHFDSNTPETSITGNPHGMVAAIYMGKGDKHLVNLFKGKTVKPENVFIFGAQTEYFDFFLSDEREQKNLDNWGVNYITKPQIDKEKGKLNKLFNEVDKIYNNVDDVLFSLDMDVIDNADSPGVAMSNPSGLSKGQLLKIVDYIHKNNSKIIAMSIVEIDPTKDTSNKTLKLATEVIIKILKNNTSKPKSL